MRLLLTGFEPFGGDFVNPSQGVVERLAAEGVTNVALATTILPVDRDAGPAALLAALAGVQPDAVICLGVATGRTAISLERVAVNLLDYRIEDNAGNQVSDEPVVPGGPAAYFTTLPLRAMEAAIREAGIPVQLSLSAGAFLCNQITYVLLHELAQRSREIPAGFIHLPAAPAQVAARNTPPPSMALETLCQAVRIACEVVAAPTLATAPTAEMR